MQGAPCKLLETRVTWFSWRVLFCFVFTDRKEDTKIGQDLGLLEKILLLNMENPVLFYMEKIPNYS